MKIAMVVPGGVDRSGERRVIPAFVALIDRMAGYVDLQVFALHGVHGMAVPTALTVQTTEGVRRTNPVFPSVVAEQLIALLGDMISTDGTVAGTTLFKDIRVRTSSPAPVINSSAMAISATASVCRTRPTRSEDPRPPRFIASTSGTRAASRRR